MIRAHLLRFLGGGLGGPLRILPEDSVARAKPALGTGHSLAIDVSCDAVPRLPRENRPRSSAGFAGATIPGGRLRQGGEAPLRLERTGSTPRARTSGTASQLDPLALASFRRGAPGIRS